MRITMSSFSHIIPIDRNGFFCTSRESLEASTTDNVFSLETPQCQPYTRDIYTSPTHKSDNFEKIATITPENAAKDSTNGETQNPKAEVKRWARGMLKAEPCSFVTQAGLLLALKHNAPAPVIQFMLKINPNVMNFPKVGPTPLQVAVQYNAELDVVQMLLNASPVGECIRNADFPESALEYAKRCHSNRPDLIELLNRKSKTRDKGREKKQRGRVGFQSDFNLFPRYSSFPLQQATSYKSPLLSPPPSFSTRRARANSIISTSTTSEPTLPTPVPTTKKKILSEVKISLNKNDSRQARSVSRSSATLPEKRDQANKSNINREELNNIKTLCTLLWKSQRKMAKQMNASKDEIESQSKFLATMGTKDEILEELMKQQRSQMFRNWITLDIKERSYQKQLEKMEQRYIEQLEKRLHSWTGSMRLWNESTREELHDLRAFVDSEVETNEYFRSNMTDWIEKYTENQENDTNIPSEVFATNLGEVNQKVPLCAGFRGTFCGVGTDTTTDGHTDPIIGVDEYDSPVIRIKKRSWMPLFKHRDYSAVE